MKKQSVAKIERRALHKLRMRLIGDFGLSIEDLRGELHAQDSRGGAGEYAVRLPDDAGARFGF